MSEQISGSLSRISANAKKINKLADKATEQIRSLGEFLASLNLGVETWDPESTKGGREVNSAGVQSQAMYYVGYARADDARFGLVMRCQCFVTDRDGALNRDNDDNGVCETRWIRPLDKVSRDLRIAAMKRMPIFISVLADGMEATANGLQADIVALDNVADELKAALAKTAPSTIKPAKEGLLSRVIREANEMHTGEALAQFRERELSDLESRRKIIEEAKSRADEFNSRESHMRAAKDAAEAMRDMRNI